MFNVCNDGIICFVSGTATRFTQDSIRISFFIRSINVCCILSVVSWCLFDRLATTSESWISLSCQLMCSRSPMTFTFWFCVCITLLVLSFFSFSFIWYGRQRLYRHCFQIPTALWLNFSSFYAVFFLLSSAFVAISLTSCVGAVFVLYCAFKRKLHPTCQKNHTKNIQRSSKPKGIGTIQASISSLS